MVVNGTGLLCSNIDLPRTADVRATSCRLTGMAQLAMRMGNKEP